MRYLIVLLLAGCATNTGVVSMGPDTYMIAGSSATGLAAGGEVMADLYRQANAFCGSQQKQLLPINTQARDGNFGRSYANAKIEFRCLVAGDPELRRPTMESAPNTVIEDRRR